ncbi:MAG: DNA adenine methylase [Rhodospirillaceae bacterium]|nr:DNA adenine methylase [Rhodospirillaceae bacterium]
MALCRVPGHARYQLTTRAEFERLLAVDPETLTDLQRTARFLYLQRTVFGGKPGSRSFGVSVSRPARFDVTKLVPVLEDIHSRLTRVVIECLSYEAFIPRYDRADTLFYVDPPYFGCEDYYGKEMFGRDDFARLAGLLERIKGRFILSINDRPEVRAIFGAFRQVPVELKYSVSAQGSVSAAELIITNQPGLT